MSDEATETAQTVAAGQLRAIIERIERLRSLQGMVVLSGYATDLYDQALPDWQRIERRALADGARERREVIWLNPACCRAGAGTPLFAGVA